jgi:hypothetical protein
VWPRGGDCDTAAATAGRSSEPKIFPISCGPISFCQERGRANLRMVDFSTPVP